MDDLNELQTEVTRYRAILDDAHAAHVGLAETDSRGVIRAANPYLAALLGVPTSFLRGKPFLHFVARGDCSAFRAFIDGVQHDGGSGEAHAIFARLRPRHGGAPFHADMRVQPAARGVSEDARVLVWTVQRSGELLHVTEGDGSEGAYK